MRTEIMYVLAEVANNYQTGRYLRQGSVGADETFAGVAPPDEMLTRYEVEAESFRSEQEASAFAERHQMARFGHGYQREPHLSPEQTLRSF